MTIAQKFKVLAADLERHRISYESKPDKQFDQFFELRRAVCRCGWKGCWYEGDDYAESSGQRHLRQVRT